MPRAIPGDRFHALIQAATAVFLEQGYQRTQIADVAARMQLAKGSIYTYVASKEALFDCVLRFADQADRIELPGSLPVPTPPPESTLAMVEERIRDESALPALAAALGRTRVTNVGAELEAILGELYDALTRHRTAIKLLDRCAADYPELAKLWHRGGREGALALLTQYVEDRTRRGRFHRFEDVSVAVRLVLETLVFWAVHRFWDPSPQVVGDEPAKRTALAFITRALVKE